MIPLGRVHTTEGFEDQRAMNEAHEHDVELLEAREDPSKALQSPEEALDLVASPIHLPVVLPGLDTRLDRRHHGLVAEIQSQLAGLVPFVGTVHEQVQTFRPRTEMFQKFSARRCIARLAGTQGERYGRSSIRGNHMNLGCPSTAGFSDGLRSVFFSAPVPSG